MNPLHDLADQWREEAETLKQYDADWLVAACEEHADQLENAIREHENEKLTVQEAAEESGYSEPHLRRLIREGDLRNAGEKHRPRIRRCDLPRKPGSGSRSVVAESDPDTVASATRMDGSVTDSS